jgi:hypothetical protein
MTASAQAALDAMADAEDEARRFSAQRIYRERLRLIERDRDTLALHQPTDYGDGQPASCEVCGVHSPCDDLQAVIRYWCHDEETP